MAIDSVAAFKERCCDSTMQLGAHAKRFEDAADWVLSITFTQQNGEEERYNHDIIMKGLGDMQHTDRTKPPPLF